MRFAFLCTAAVVLCAGPALAQGKIIVKNADGTTQELEVPGAFGAPVQPDEVIEPAVPHQPKVHVFKEPEKPSILNPAGPDVAEEPAVDVPDVQKPVIKKVGVKTEAMPSPEPAPKRREPRPDDAPYSPPKPDKPGKMVSQPQPVAIPDGYPITEKLAKRIALRIAPPSRDIDVYRRSFEERAVYLVRFKTDKGFFDVLVDMESGDIVATKEGSGA